MITLVFILEYLIYPFDTVLAWKIKPWQRHHLDTGILAYVMQISLIFRDRHQACATWKLNWSVPFRKIIYAHHTHTLTHAPTSKIKRFNPRRRGGITCAIKELISHVDCSMIACANFPVSICAPADNNRGREQAIPLVNALLSAPGKTNYRPYARYTRDASGKWIQAD